MVADLLAGRKYAPFPLPMVTFPSCPQALEKSLKMCQDFGLCVRNVLLACEKPPSEFSQDKSPWRDKSSCSQALPKSGQLKTSATSLYSSLTAPHEPPKVYTWAPLRETKCCNPGGTASCWGLTKRKVPLPQVLTVPGGSSLSPGMAYGKAEGAGVGEGRRGLGWE